MHLPLDPIPNNNLYSCREHRLPESGDVRISTGHPLLDATLPHGGWPLHSVIDMVTPHWGMGEIQLLFPLLQHFTQLQRRVILVVPPKLPDLSVLRHAGIDLDYVTVIDASTSCYMTLDSIEQALQAQDCALVLSWISWLPNGVIRRLQIAAESANSLIIMFRKRNDHNSPAQLRLHLHASNTGVHVQILKAHGSYSYQSVHINVSMH